MSFCDEKLSKLKERIERPLPLYDKHQIVRTRVIASDLLEQRPLESQSEQLEAVAAKLENQREPLALKRRSNSDDSEGSGNQCEEGLQSRPADPSVRQAPLERPFVQNPQPPQQSLPSIPRTDKDKSQRVLMEGLLKQREAMAEQLAFQSAKRIKESQAFDSNPAFLLINPGLEQRNKITDYFKLAQGNEGGQAKAFENLTTFSQANLLISDEQLRVSEGQLSTKWEMILNEKEREVISFKRMLKAKEDQLADFKERATVVLSRTVLESEELRRNERKRFICEEKLRLGEYVAYRCGAQLKEVWVNGMEIRMLREELQKITDQKEQIEGMKKRLKKRSGKALLGEDRTATGGNNPTDKVGSLSTQMAPSSIVGMGNQPGSNFLASVMRQQSSREARLTGSLNKGPNPDLSDSSNNFSSVPDKSAEECRERLNSRLLILTKEENFLREKIDSTERQKETYIRMAKQLCEEENCRFGRLGGDADSRWPLLKKRYQLYSLIGKGGFSEVYKAFDCEELRVVACKIHQLSPSWSENFKSNYIKHALRENQVHKNLSHPNIVSHFDSVEIDSNSFCAVLEFCNGPDLGSYLRKHRTVPEKDARSVAKQLVSGLRFLNETSKKIIHYDLKPQNILFHDGLIKISDFGLCKVMNEGETRLELTSQGVGTYWYLPPECFCNGYPKISTKVDVWSVGVILFELLYGVKPFGNDMCQEKILKEGVMLRAYTLDFPTKPVVSNELKELIRKCLEYNQEDRLDVIDVYNLLTKL